MYELYKPFDFLSKDECQSLINWANTQKKEAGQVFGEKEQDWIVDKNVRTNKIVWVYDKKIIKKYLNLAKKIDKRVKKLEALKISFYRKDDFYGWHHDDCHPKKYKHWFIDRSHKRVLSIVTELQPAPESGLFIDHKSHPNIPRNKDYTIKLKQGQAIVFPSKEPHMARNLGNGERISLIGHCWALESDITKH